MIFTCFDICINIIISVQIGIPYLLDISIYLFPFDIVEFLLSGLCLDHSSLIRNALHLWFCVLLLALTWYFLNGIQNKYVSQFTYHACLFFIMCKHIFLDFCLLFTPIHVFFRFLRYIWFFIGGQ